MFTAARMLYIYVETSLHAGTGRGLGAIDLPIQRERITDYPIVQASSLKGRLRAECYESFKKNVYKNLNDVIQERLKEGGSIDIKEDKFRLGTQMHGLEAAFGPDTDHGDEHAGAVSTGDARILLFPVRSLAGVFAWTTSVEALARFMRCAGSTGTSLEPNTSQASKEFTLPPSPQEGEAWISSQANICAGKQIVLEEFSFTPKKENKEENKVDALGKWLAENALPQDNIYNYWREQLPKRLVILPENAFRDFTKFSTEVVTRTKICQKTKTVENGALWTEESLPTDTLLYAPLMAAASRMKENELLARSKQDAKSMLNLIEESLPGAHIQLGGNETVGRGTVHLRFGEINELTVKPEQS